MSDISCTFCFEYQTETPVLGLQDASYFDFYMIFLKRTPQNLFFIDTNELPCSVFPSFGKGIFVVETYDEEGMD